MKTNLFAVSGTQSTGKSTLVNHLKEITGWEVVKSPTREILSSYPNMKNNEETDEYSQDLLFMGFAKKTQWILENHNIDTPMLCDRCILDVFAYSTWLFKHNKLSKEAYGVYEQMFLNDINAYDAIFYVSPEDVELHKDEFRSDSNEYRDELDEIFREIFKAYKMKVIFLTGTLEEKSAAIMKVVNS